MSPLKTNLPKYMAPDPRELRLRNQMAIDDKAAMMDQATFDALLTYSTTVPTGVAIGKIWKRDLAHAFPGRGEGWELGAYEESQRGEDFASIVFREIIIV